MGIEKSNKYNNDNQIMVSVIVITYNHERFIRQAIDSVIMQKTNFKYEIIVGDDCSLDKTQEIIMEYYHEYPDLIIPIMRKQNIGSSANAYDALNRAKGKYLATCEGDDFWIDEYKLQKQVDFLESNKEYVGCVHPVNYVDENNRIIKSKKIQWISGKKTFSISDFNGGILPGHPVSLVRRNLLLEKGFDKEFIYKANPNICDRTCALLWLAKGDFYQLDDVMASYRQIKSGTNMTSKQYKNNEKKYTDDYEYTLILENYSKKVLGVNANFDIHKRDLFAKAFISSFYRKSIDNKLPNRIIKENGNKTWYYRGIIIFLFRKLFEITGG